MNPGDHVRILSQPYEGREGVVVLVDPSGPRFQHWPVWVNVLGYDDGPKGFERHELAVLETERTAPICPECGAGKHQNCDGSAWNDAADDVDACACEQAGHAK